MTSNEHITRYLLKTIFFENHGSNFFIFAPEEQKALESQTVHQNVRNGHIYIQLMQQHMSLNEQITRYSLKTDLQNDASFYAFSPKFSGR